MKQHRRWRGRQAGTGRGCEGLREQICLLAICRLSLLSLASCPVCVNHPMPALTKPYACCC
jgi:hypothetical protein